MHLGHQVGPGVDQYLVAPLELGAAEVVRPQAEQLQVGAHGAVEDDGALPQRLQVRGCGRVETSEEFGRGGHKYSRLPAPPDAP